MKEILLISEKKGYEDHAVFQRDSKNEQFGLFIVLKFQNCNWNLIILF